MRPVLSRRFIALYFIIGLIVLALLWNYYSQKFLRQMESETELRSRLYAAYVKSLSAENTEKELLNIIFDEVIKKINFPVIITDSLGNIMASRNLKDTTTAFKREFLKKLDKKKEPIDIKTVLPEGDTLFLGKLHYGLPGSFGILKYFPIIQLAFIISFVLLGLFAIFEFIKRENDHLWVSLTKEAAHQLGTPVSSLLAWMEFLKDKLDKDTIEQIRFDVDRVQDIVNRFSRIGTMPELHEIDIKKVVHETLRFIKRRASSLIEFKEDVKPVERILGDEVLLSWVLENLFKNSLDAIGPAKGMIEVKTEVLRDAKTYNIYIIDSGEGIKDKGKIFNPGYTTKSHGWGIGLVLAKRIIESHKGKLRVIDSKKGLTTILIQLPIR